MITVNFVVWMRHSNKIIILDNEYSLKWKWKIEEIFEIEPRINVDLTHHKNQMGFVRFVCHVNNDFFFFSFSIDDSNDISLWFYTDW